MLEAVSLVAVAARGRQSQSGVNTGKLLFRVSSANQSPWELLC